MDIRVFIKGKQQIIKIKMEIPEWSKQCELQRNRMKRILCLEDSTNARTLSYLDPMSLLELRSACKELKSRVEQYDGWSFILIELFLPNLRIMEPFDEESISSSDLLPPDNPQCLKLTSIKNKRHQLWFSYFNSAASLLGDCFTGSELSDPIQLLSKNLLRELKSRPR